ncbi:hypothetical protein LLH03_18375 [bacterium]|nr:hypothetical protein [bacterium]
MRTGLWLVCLGGLVSLTWMLGGCGNPSAVDDIPSAPSVSLNEATPEGPSAEAPAAIPEENAAPEVAAPENVAPAGPAPEPPQETVPQSPADQPVTPGN